MSTSSKRPRKVSEEVGPTLSHAEQIQAMNEREAGKTVMYRHDAWGHMETRFVRTQNVAAWQAKGFIRR
ncbi:hypothetical protein [Hymenobacter sp. UYP22]|uniref:hypothetical protein n=1 Tax=Hymenobacter sp. UYP22 TaxID=3156348 RepID=UPI003390B4DA